MTTSQMTNVSHATKLTPHSTGLSFMLAQDAEVLGAPSADGAPAGIEGESGANGGGNAAPTPGAGGFGNLLPILIAVMLFMVVTTFLGGRKDKKKRAQMMAGMKKTDRVQTIGGLLGTIVEMRENEVVLKVHEASNTRITVTKASIQQVVKSGRGSNAAGDDSTEAFEEATEQEMAAAS